MVLIHLHTNVKGVRFFKRTGRILKSAVKNYVYTRTINEFKRNLLIDALEYDVVLITMHGAVDSFIMPNSPHRSSRSGYHRAISLGDAHLFKRDCVIAIACSTAKELGHKAIAEGALAYLGYDRLIEPVFKIDIESQIPMNKVIRNFYQDQIKRIYTEVVANAVEAFIKNFQTVEILKQTISLQFEKKANELFDLDASAIEKKFNWKVNSALWKKEWPKIKLLQMGIINEINNHFVILGDKDYISLIGLYEGIIITDKAKERILKASFGDKDYERMFHSAIDLKGIVS